MMHKATREVFLQVTDEWSSTRKIVLKCYPDAYQGVNAKRIHNRIISRLQKMARDGLIEKRPNTAYTPIKNWVHPQLRRCTQWRLKP